MLLRRPKLPTMTISFGLLTSATARREQKARQSSVKHIPSRMRLPQLALDVDEPLDSLQEDGETQCEKKNGVSECRKDFCTSVTWMTDSSSVSGVKAFKKRRTVGVIRV